MGFRLRCMNEEEPLFGYNTWHVISTFSSRLFVRRDEKNVNFKLGFEERVLGSMKFVFLVFQRLF